MDLAQQYPPLTSALTGGRGRQASQDRGEHLCQREGEQEGRKKEGRKEEGRKTVLQRIGKMGWCQEGQSSVLCWAVVAPCASRGLRLQTGISKAERDISRNKGGGRGRDTVLAYPHGSELGSSF